MLSDLLPIPSPDITRVTAFGRSGRNRVAIRFLLPAGWAIYSNENQTQESNFEVTNFNHAVFVVGSRLRVSRSTVSGMSLNLVADGDWAFTDTDASELAAKVLKAHRDV